MQYELWLNGQQCDSIFCDGHEYVEAWTSIDGVPTLVWAKDGGSLGGGFYDASGNLVMKWFETYELVGTYSSKKINIPNYTHLDLPINQCYYLEDTLDALRSTYEKMPIKYEDIYKIVVPKEVNDFKGGTSGSVIGISDSNVKEVIFENGEGNISFDVSHIIYGGDNVEKIVFSNQISSFESGILYYTGKSDGCLVDLSNTKITKLNEYSFQSSKIKTLLLPDTLTSYTANAFSGMGSYSVALERLYMPNVHDYPLLGSSMIDEIETPPDSVLRGGFSYQVACKKYKINTNTVLKSRTLMNQGNLPERIELIGNNFTFNSQCIQLYSPTELIFDDSIEEFKVEESSSEKGLFEFRDLNTKVHLPNKLKIIKANTFDVNMNVLDIPSSVQEFEGSIFVSDSFLNKLVIRNADITVPNDSIDQYLASHCTLYFDGANANDWVMGHSTEPTNSWKEILPVSAYDG